MNRQKINKLFSFVKNQVSLLQGIAHLLKGLIALLDELINNLTEIVGFLRLRKRLEVLADFFACLGGGGEPELRDIASAFVGEEVGELLNFGADLRIHLGDLPEADAHGFALGLGHFLDEFNGLSQALKFIRAEGKELVELFELPGKF